MQQHTGLVHGHMHELFYHNMRYCEWHRRTLCGKTVIFNLNMQAHILLFCLRAIKKQVFLHILRKTSVVPGPGQLTGTMLE